MSQEPGALPQIIPNAMGSRSMPTLVGFNERGERLVGERAASSPCNGCVFPGSRDLLGEPFENLKNFWGRTFSPYAILKAGLAQQGLFCPVPSISLPHLPSAIPQESKRATTRVSTINGQSYSPEELAAMVLKVGSSAAASSGCSHGRHSKSSNHKRPPPS